MSAVLTPATTSTTQARPALAELLQGTDVRAQSPYGLPMPASDALVHFGSCTANPITPTMLAQHQALKAQHAGPDPQDYLRELFGAAQCRLAASGTDAEYTCALAMGPDPYCCILMDPAEIGSGCTRAAAGLAHAQGCPVDVPLHLQATIETTRLRDASGRPLTQAEVDAQVFDIAARHVHLPILLHHVACSKTGLCSPSEAACLSLQRGHASGVRVVVDASQGRFDLDDVHRWLDYGWAVIITGSKYFGAPPFCGATLLPIGWPLAQGFASGPGLRARWRLAIDAMSLAPQQPSLWSSLLRTHFVRHLPLARIDDDSGQDRQGILSFDLGLDAAQTLRLHRTLITRGFFIGQPVAAGPRNLLRVALGARTPMQTAAHDLERLARAIKHEMAHG